MIEPTETVAAAAEAGLAEAVFMSARVPAQTGRHRLAGPEVDQLAGRIVTVAAWKGGVGKTTLAGELAYLLDAVLVDLDWDLGGISRAWGYRHEARANAPLLDALEHGRVPRPLRGKFKADLVPSHPDFVDNQPKPERLAEELERWAVAWNRPVVVDTHPGGVPSTYGAVSAAHLVLVPQPLATRELDALEGMLAELADYPLLVVPNMVPPIPPDRETNTLERLTKQYDVPVGPHVSRHEWLKRRQRRMAVSAADEPAARARQYVEELRRVTKVVVSHVRTAA